MITLPYGVISLDGEVISSDEFLNSEMEAWFYDSKGQIDLLKLSHYGFLLVHFTFAPLEDQKPECIWKVHQEILRIKIRQNGHYYEWENHLETKILEVESKKSHKDVIWRAEQRGGEHSWGNQTPKINSQSSRKISQASEFRAGCKRLDKINCPGHLNLRGKVAQI